MRTLLYAVALCFTVTSCVDDAPLGPDATVETTAEALTGEVALVPRLGSWQCSPLGGDRGTAWRAPGYAATTGWQTCATPAGYGETYVSPISYGSDPNHKPPTVYFLRTFQVDDASLVRALRLEAMYDDGFVAYVNGHEIKRASMPTGTVSYSTLSTGHEAESAWLTYDVSAATPFLVTGPNVLAVEVHQQAVSSSDLVFAAALFAQVDEAAPPPSDGGIPRADTWSYWDGGGNLGTAWRGTTYDDGAWRSGAGPLGYGESYVSTTIGYGPSSSSKYITTYFRRELTIDDPEAVTQMLGELMYDDGVVVYLNGVEIGRAAMPAGTITSSTLATGHEAENVYEGYDWSAHTDLLVAGVNVIAVEVHQQAASSSDLVFDLSLAISTAPPPPPPDDPTDDDITKRYTWIYNDKGTNLGTAWRQPGYQASTATGWASAPAPMGYGEDYLDATIGYGPDAGNKYVTTYFLRYWTVDLTDTQITSMKLHAMYDDGVVVYLNGTELTRLSMPTGTITSSTLALGHEAGDAYETYDVTAQRGLIRNGANVIAVEVHQQARSSSDLVFDVGLDLDRAPVFTKYAGNPMFEASGDPFADPTWRRDTIGRPAVIRRAANDWVMFYTGNDGVGAHYAVGMARSTDGLHWTLDHDPAIQVGLVTAAVFDGTTTYVYTRDNWEDYGEVYTSTDLVTWTSRGQIFGDSGGLRGDYAIARDGAGVFHAWYDDIWRHNHATSGDGITWTNIGIPNLIPRTAMWTSGGWRGWRRDDATDDCRYLTSSEGQTWSERGVSMTPGPAGAWDSGGVDCSSVMLDGAGYRAWYGGGGTDSAGASHSGIGAASSP